MFLLWNIQLRSICPGFPRFFVPFPACREFAIFPPATWSLWFVRLRLASHWFPLTSCHSAGLLNVFSLGFFHFFSLWLWKRTLISGVFPYSFKHIFVILIIEKSFLDHQLLPKHEPISSLVFLAMLLEKELSLFYLQTQTIHLLRLWSYAPHSTQIVSRGPLKTSYCAQIK